MYGKARNPFVSLIYTVLTAFLIVVAAYVVYKGVIVGDLMENVKIVGVFKNIINWGIALGKDIGDFLISLAAGASE